MAADKTRAHPFLERLRRGTLLGDGAMGTQLHARGVSFERSFDELNLTEPKIVEEIHRAYISAGAELIETNTFGANRIKLARHGLEGRVRDINFRAVKLAREAREISGEQVFIAGSVGPIGQQLEPIGRISIAQATAAFEEQIAALLEGGADLLVLETFTNLPELLAAVAAARRTADLPIVVQMTFAEDGLTLSAEEPSQVVQALERAGVDVIGVNCGVGPQVALQVLEAMRQKPDCRCRASPTPAFRRGLRVGSSTSPPRNTSRPSPARPPTSAWPTSAAVAAPRRRTSRPCV